MPESAVTQHEAAIDHDALANFASAEHVDWAASSAGTIHITNFAGLQNVSEDASPQLGADLDAQGNNLDEVGVINLIEQAEADSNVAGRGQIWVNTASPNQLFFTDDADNDIRLAEQSVGTIIGAEKAANETTNTDIVVSDDSDLVIALTAGTWAIECIVYFAADVTGSMGMQFELTYGGTTTRGFYALNMRVNQLHQITTSPIDFTKVLNTIHTSIANPDYLHYSGSLVVSDSDNLAFRWAQNSSEGDDLNVLINSSLVAIKTA